MRQCPTHRSSDAASRTALPEHPDDIDRKIALLLQQALDAPKDNEPASPLDEATLRRVMNGLRAKGAFVQAAPTAARGGECTSGWPAGPQWRFSFWLGRRRSNHQALPGRRDTDGGTRTAWAPWVLPAAFVMALVVAASLAGLSPKPATPQPAGVQGKQVAEPDDSVMQTIHSSQPRAEADRMVQILAESGVLAHTETAGDDSLLRARVPTALLSRLEPILQAEGLALPPSGQLVLRFTSAQR